MAVPREQAAVLADYLAESFPVKPRPAAVLIPGRATAWIREWVVPFGHGGEACSRDGRAEGCSYAHV